MGELSAFYRIGDLSRSGVTGGTKKPDLPIKRVGKPALHDWRLAADRNSGREVSRLSCASELPLTTDTMSGRPRSRKGQIRATNDTADAATTPRSRDARVDVSAIALCAFTAFLLVSLLTHDAADPVARQGGLLVSIFCPSVTRYPLNQEIQNACGIWGAWVSALLIGTLGIASALIVAACGGVGTALLLRGKLNAPVLRSLGGTLIVLATCTGLGMLSWRPSGFPVVGSGGYLGAMTSTMLHQHFADAGAWILIGTVLAVGVLMTTDYALLYAGKMVVQKTAQASRPMVRNAQAWRHRRRRAMVGNDVGALRHEMSGQAGHPATDNDDHNDSPTQDDGPAIRIRGNKRSTTTTSRNADAVGTSAAAVASLGTTAGSSSPASEDDYESHDEDDDFDAYQEDEYESDDSESAADDDESLYR
ncbi:MAG: DNA translocase FtsK 4TM domain-containing protein, partial [Planctomycetota bacterium]